MGKALTKASIDLSCAMADGLKDMPALYGDRVRKVGEVRGWRSGAVVGAKVCFDCFVTLLLFYLYSFYFICFFVLLYFFGFN